MRQLFIAFLILGTVAACAANRPQLSLQTEGEIRGSLFSADDSKILTWSMDGTVRLWDVSEGKELVPAMRHEMTSDAVGIDKAFFSPDGTRILFFSPFGWVRLWDVRTGEEINQVYYTRGVASAVFSADSSKVLSASNRTARLWDPETSKELVQMQHEAYVSSAVFNADNSKILTASWDCTTRLWDAKTGKELIHIRDDLPEVDTPIFSPDSNYTAIFSPDSNKILTASPDARVMRLYDARTGTELVPHMRLEGIIRSVVFSADGNKILTTAWASTESGYDVQLWDSATGKEIVPPPRLNARGRADDVRAMFSPDDSKILVSYLDTFGFWRSRDWITRIYNAHTGEELVPPLRGGNGTFSSDGSKVLTRSPHKAAIYDVKTGEQLVPDMEHADIVSAVFSASGNKIFTASRDGRLKLWDVRPH